MHWHAQITSLTLRGFELPGGYAEKLPFLASAQAELLGDSLAYVHAASRLDGRQLSVNDWRDVAILLRDQFRVETLLYHRGKRLVTIPTARA